ncbi:MAG: class I SAM-dependent methyltransferase [Hyphomicrobiales bacterium]|nr:class I SAM-dependent methyltransferase [Hyphomicrobiales bacterium]MCC2106016.1 class I SAM-dependent methyltransferase [Hyphomicrobiales bacterium]MCC2109398.1 class I SAM-dependent methyltransferase [Hyphomicrobiales bacterium]
MSFVSDSDWRKWGEIDPYFGVVSFEEFKAERIAGNRERFFATGRREVDTAMREIFAHYGEVAHRRALDFGSGVGRLALPLAERYDAVVGVDISEAMIAEARENCRDAGVANAEFVLSDDGLTRLDGSFDLVHSYIVLQHIPVERGLALTAQMLARLAPGGVACLHYSLQRTLPPARELVYALKHHVPGGRIAMNLLQRRAWDTPTMQMNNYPLARILHLYEEYGLEDVFITPEWQETALTARVHGRKKA